MSKQYSHLLETYIKDKSKTLIQDDNFYYLYKHFSLDPELNTLGVFNNNTLKYSYPVDYNDPYDCFCDIELDYTNFKKSTFEKYIKQKISAPCWFANKNSLLLRNKNAFKQDDFIDGYKKFITVTCFNNAPLNILMWSHYANHHKGFMLEFKYRKTSGIGKLPLPVFYQDKLPKIIAPWDMQNPNEDKNMISEIIIKSFLTKSKDWEYENEFRQTSKDGSQFQKFLPTTLSSVILGTKTSDEDELHIKNALINFNIKYKLNTPIFKSKLSTDHYKLYVDGHPRLDR